MKLGHPIGDNVWVIEVDISKDETGNAQTVPIAFSRDQAHEIARRIVAYYRMTDEDLA